MKLDNAKQKEFVADLFGKYDADIHKLMKKKIGAMQKSVAQLKENFAIGLTFARKEMPQIGASDSFIKYLKSNDVESKRVRLDPNKLKSSQMEFDQNKIDGLRNTPSSNPIIVSRDNHVIDGHHRWLADKLEGRQSDAYMCDLPVLELLHQAKIYSKQLKEEVTRKELAPMLDSFVSFASDKLGLKSMPKVRYKTDGDNYNSFAAYNPSSNELSVHTMNRHPMDIFRSVAHELVHHKQNEDGKLGKDIEKEGATGSDIENEANSEAGKIMRWFAKANPNMFSKSYVVETTNSAAMSPGGVRGLGNVTGEVSPTVVSQYVVNNQSVTAEMQSNIDNTVDTFYTWNDNNWWMNSDDKKKYHAKTVKTIRSQAKTLNEGINDPGKLKAIFLAGGPGSGKDYVMNSVLKGEGLKEINSDVAFEFLMKRNGLDLEMPDEERVERDIVRGRAKNMTKEQERLALAGRLGLIINGTADDLEKIKKVKAGLEADGYETMMVFVNTSNEVSRERNVERGKMGNRKVPDGTDKNGVPDNSPNIRQEKWDAAQKNIGELQKIFGNDSFAVIDNSIDVRKVSPEVKEKVLTSFNRVRRMAQQFVRAENKNPAAKKWIEGETQKRGITQYQEPKRYKSLTQVKTQVPNVIHKPDNEIMQQARRLGLSYYGFGRFGRKVGAENKVLYHSKGGKLVKVQTMNEAINEKFEKYMKDPANREIGTDSLAKIYKKGTPGQEVAEDNVIPRGGLPKGNGIGPEFGIQVSPALVTGFANIGNSVTETAKSIQEWANNPKTQQKFATKYGKLAEQKLMRPRCLLSKQVVVLMV
jgi:cytidylate kinase